MRVREGLVGRGRRRRSQVACRQPLLFAFLAQHCGGIDEPQNLANLAWCLATAKWSDLPAITLLSEGALRLARHFGPQVGCGKAFEPREECANFAWALATLMLPHPCLVALSTRFATGARRAFASGREASVAAHRTRRTRCGRRGTDTSAAARAQAAGVVQHGGKPILRAKREVTSQLTGCEREANLSQAP